MADTVIIYNPQSGGGSHADDVEDRADLSGYAVERSEHAGEAVTLTQEAIEAGYSTIVAGGGDGTVNEVVQGSTGPTRSTTSRSASCLSGRVTTSRSRSALPISKPRSLPSMTVSGVLSISGWQPIGPS